MATYSSNAMESRGYTNIVFSLGGVFAFYSSKGLGLPVNDSQLKLIMDSPVWHEHECGSLDRDVCVSRLSILYGVKPKDLAETLQRLTVTLRLNYSLLSFVRGLRETYHERIKVYLMMNIGQFEWETLRPTIHEWDIFDDIFPSFQSRSRKPNHEFFKVVSQSVAIDTPMTIFVDDKPENVMAGQALGMHGVHFESTEEVVTKLSSILGHPVQRGEAWMETHAKNLWSHSNTGVQILDQFAQMLILHLTGDQNLVKLSNSKRTWNVFGYGKPVLTSAHYPDDLDTTTIALLTLNIASKVKTEVMDEMLDFVTEDGLFYTYFDPTRPRLDPCVTANILRLFYAQGRGAQVARGLEYMCRILAHRAYTTGTRYYFQPDWFFFYLSDLCARHANSTAGPPLGELRRLLTLRLRERMGCAKWSDPFSAAMRVVAAQNLGLENPRDLEILVATQQVDGSWSKDPWVYRYGNSGILFGNGGLVTAMALRALRAAPKCAVKEAIDQI